MFSHRFDQNPSSRVVFHWFMLSFNGGCINAGGFLATGKFVSHVTGFATLFGVDALTGNIKLAISMLVVPIFFLLGAFIAGMMIEHPVSKNKSPHFDWVMGISTLCLCMAATFGQYGQFGETFRLKHTFILLALLCLACGLQNAAITASSLRSVRTTHLTGITTDLGLGLARLFATTSKSKRIQDEIRFNWLRFGSIASFVLGSAAGAYIFLQMGYFGFYIPALITAYAAWHGRMAKKNYGLQT